MIQTIEKLKSLAEDIQAAKLGKRGEAVPINSYTVIDEYQEWRTGVEDLFSQYFDKTNALYEKFISLPSGGNGYVLMNYFDQQYPIFKVLVKKIESGETIRSIQKTKEMTETKKEERDTIFISHAIKDKKIVDAFVDLILIEALSVPIDQIFCVSTDGAKIKSGADWRDFIKERLISAKVNFLIITPNYKESEVCLNEMGAAWVTSAYVLPLIVDPINYKTVGILQEPKQIEKLLDENSLDRIRDIIQDELEIPTSRIKSDRWSMKKGEFLSRVNSHIAANPFQVPIDRDSFDSLQKENFKLNQTVEILNEKNARLGHMIDDLRLVKDMDRVEEVIKKHTRNSDYGDFITVVEKAKRQLAIFSPIMRGIIFKEFTGKDIIIHGDYYEDDINEAVAKDYITGELDVDWETTVEMQNIYESLKEISEILDKELTEDFFTSFNRDYKVPLKLDNKTFWEKVFEVKINF